MSKRNNISLLAASGIVISVAVLSLALLAGAAGAQYFPAPMPFGYGGYGYPGFDGYYGTPYGMPVLGDSLSPYGVPAYMGQQVSYGMPSYAGQPAPVSYGQPAAAGGYGNALTIPGLEGLVGFMPGENKLSLAVIPVSQQNGMLGFQVIGFAIASSGGQAAVYSLSQPLAGVIDPAQNTLQIDLSNLANNVNQAGFVSADAVYSTIRSDPKVIVIDVDMNSQGVQGTQAIFSVNSVAIIPPDGQMQAFAMQQPTQLIIDAQSMRIYMVAFPQMVNAFTGYYGMTWPQVLPIVYVQPVPVLAPIFVPFLQPFPIFFSGFIGFNPFFFGSGFVSFFDRASFHGGFPIHDRDFGTKAFSQFAGARGIGKAGVSAGTAAGGKVTQPSGLAKAGAPGVSATSGAGKQAGFSNAATPGASVGSRTGIGATGANQFAGLGNIQQPSGFTGARTPGMSIGSGTGMPSFKAGNMPSVSGLGSGIGSGIGSMKGAGMGSGMRMSGGRR